MGVLEDKFGREGVASRRDQGAVSRSLAQGKAMTRELVGQAELLSNPEERLLPSESFHGTPAFLLDIPETIPALGYGSHQFFRYYGKFPSLLGREIIARVAPPDGLVV